MGSTYISVQPGQYFLSRQFNIFEEKSQEGKGEILRAGKPRDEEDAEEDRHQVT